MFFAPPAAWAIQLVAGYGLVAVACALDDKIAFYVLSAAAALVTLAAGRLSFLSARGRMNVRDLEAADAPGEFLAACGVLLAIVFFVLIAATGLYGAFLNPCSPINMALP